MISEIIREEEELKCIQQAQLRCDFSEYAQQPSAVPTLGPQLGGIGRSWRSRRERPLYPQLCGEVGLGSCGWTDWHIQIRGVTWQMRSQATKRHGGILHAYH